MSPDESADLEIGQWTNQVHEGDCLDVLAEMPADSVHMCMTSPPYYGLRDYDADGQIGLEDSLDEYIQKLVDVGEALRRVLRPDGSWWLNLGDTYSGSWGGQSHDADVNNEADPTPGKNPASTTPLGPKNKMLVPYRVAIALQSAGWFVRNDATWVKSNPMPSSVTDRLNTTTEQVFHLVPQPDYWYDLDAVREPHKASSLQRCRFEFGGSHSGAVGLPRDHEKANVGTEPHEALHPAGKNPGDVFEITTESFPEAHFAVYPPKLCETPIKASCPPKVCAKCGTPYEREISENGLAGEAKIQDGERPAADERDVSETSLLRTNGRTWRDREFEGWAQACECETDDTEAGIALDPFAGAGTTLLKAKDLGRRFVGIELNGEYADMARARVGLTPEDPSTLRESEAQTGFEQFCAADTSD